ncbi:MAG: histidine phosphatase family protein, partial [Mycobacterium sp.]
MIETAAPLLADEGLPFQATPDLNEIGGGIYAGDLLSSPGGILYELTEAAWAFGFLSVPLPGSNYFNGVDFEESVNSAVQTMYNDDLTDPILSANGNITDVAVSGEAAISTWVLLNTTNPDVAIFIPRLIESLTSGDTTPFLSNAGIVQVEGNPTDGWTLVSFDGQPIPADPGLLTQLIVDFRNLIDPPQIAGQNIFEAALTGDPTTIEDALQTGLQNISTAITQFPESVLNDTVTAVQTLVADVAAGQTFTDAFDSAIVGLIP